MLEIPASDLAAWLAGTWTVEREIDGGRATFSGTARFRPLPDGAGALSWAEEGELRIDDFAGPTTRVLHLLPGEPWTVRFDDGRDFHPLDLSAGRCDAEHWCDPDTYVGTYEPLADDHLVVRWHITGPKKDTTIVSHYRRR